MFVVVAYKCVIVRKMQVSRRDSHILAVAGTHTAAPSRRWFLGILGVVISCMCQDSERDMLE